MSKETSTWYSSRLGGEITLVRWGSVGQPVLVFPTAGGDCEEIERFHLIDACSDLLTAERVKMYSVDSLAGRSWLTTDKSTAAGAAAQVRFDECLYHEVLPAIRADCGAGEADSESEGDDLSIVTAGASLGAYNALAFLCRHPESTRLAICMSGTYDLKKFLSGPVTNDYHWISPERFVPELPEDGPHLGRLRERFAVIAHGRGRFESPEESWLVANALGDRGVPNRVDTWGEEWHHDWVTWRDMLPKYLDEFL